MENLKHINLLIHYIILTAGQEDDEHDRQLENIHIIKYVYLADLAYAKQNNGEIFTGTLWHFGKFGPWSQSVYDRIEPALSAIGTQIFFIENKNKEDWFKWQNTDETLQNEIECQLPLVIIAHLKKDIHKFGQDTPALLRYIYRTSPMLWAAPHDVLDFYHLKTPSNNKIPQNNTEISKRKQKKLKEKMRNLRALGSQKTMPKRKKTFVNPPIIARQDEIYLKGMDWLDSLAGVQIPEGEQQIVFSDLIWQSLARRGL